MCGLTVTSWDNPAESATTSISIVELKNETCRVAYQLALSPFRISYADQLQQEEILTELENTSIHGDAQSYHSSSDFQLSQCVRNLRHCGCDSGNIARVRTALGQVHWGANVVRLLLWFLTNRNHRFKCRGKQQQQNDASKYVTLHEKTRYSHIFREN